MDRFLYLDDGTSRYAVCHRLMEDSIKKVCRRPQSHKHKLDDATPASGSTRFAPHCAAFDL
jgi:hypothetical protein